MITVIGLTGVKGSGKTTCFEFIKEKYPEAVEVTLASKLKDVSSEVLGVDRKSFDDPAVKEKDLEEFVHLDETNVPEIIEAFGFKASFDEHVRPHIGKVLHTPREIAQYVGTEVLRRVDPDIHCKGAVLDVPENGLAVVTDMRFWNEFDFFNDNPDYNFYPLYIENIGAEAKGASDRHASERYILDIAKKCYKIPNNGTLDQFREKVESALTHNVGSLRRDAV